MPKLRNLFRRNRQVTIHVQPYGPDVHDGWRGITVTVPGRDPATIPDRHLSDDPRRVIVGQGITVVVDPHPAQAGA